MSVGFSEPGIPAWFRTCGNHRLYFEVFPKNGSLNAIDAIGSGNSSASGNADTIANTTVNILYAPGVHESADTSTVRNLAEQYCKFGNFIVLEYHGHGRSDGQRGNVESMARVVSEISQFVGCVVSQKHVVDQVIKSGKEYEGDKNTNKNLHEGMQEFGFDDVVGVTNGEQRPPKASLISDSDNLGEITLSVQENQKLIKTERGYFTVIGHSMGGAAVMFLGDQFAEDYGKHFLGAILMAPSFVGPVPDCVTVFALGVLSTVLPFLPLGPKEHPEEYDTGSGWDLNYSGRMRLGTAALFVNLFLEVKQNLKQIDHKPNQSLNLATIQGSKNGMSESPVDCELGSNSKLSHHCTMRNYSWLILHGEKDPVVPFSHAKKIYNYYNGGNDNLSKEVIVIKGADHCPFARRTLESVETMEKSVDWIKSQLEKQLQQ